LRLADALDRTHRQLVTALDVTLRRQTVVLTLTVRGNADLETWAADKKSALFSRVFARRLKVVIRPEAGASAPLPA